MHHTFYIDIDDEISSVIDKLKKSMAKNNYFVVPQRALFMQSVVNLKLLKREADKCGKKVIIVTQDELGSSMAQRASIEVRPTLEGLEPVYLENTEEAYLEHDELNLDENNTITKENKSKQVRLSSIGSSDFYDLASDFEIKEDKKITAKSPVRKVIINQVNHIHKPEKNAKKVTVDNLVHQKVPQDKPYKKNQPIFFLDKSSKGINYDIFQKKHHNTEKLDSYKEKTLEKIFSSLSHEKVEPVVHETKKIGKKSKKIFVIFILFCLIIPLSVAAYLFLPSAKISIIPDIRKNKIETNIHASNSTQAEDKNIPIRIIDKIHEISLPYDVIGKSSTSGKKAKGSVVIYNEYSSSPQTLIATTRLESPDGKIFRLAKNVVVPGTTTIGGSLQPGATEAEVIADQAGAEYNIEETRFTIPGFSGGPKFDKFYAKSSGPMTNGASSGGDEPSALSQQDIDSAKTKTEAAIKEKISEVISSELQEGEIALSQAEKITITKSVSGTKIGDIVNSFNYNVQASVRVLVFSENDVKKIIKQSLSGESQDFTQEISKIEYVNIEADFDNSLLNLKVLGEIKNIPNIDIEKIKKEMLGKNSDQLKDVFKKYPYIKNINIEFWPSFISHISQYKSRIEVQIDANSQ